MANKFGVVGIGLIGGSMAKSLPAEVSVWDSNNHSLEAAKALGIHAAASLDDLVNTVDVLFVCVPFEAFESVFEQVQQAAARREKPILVSNVLSVMHEAEVSEPNVRFVAGHPMAGTEFSGFDAAKVGLFENATWVFSTGEPELEAITKRLGATPVVLAPEAHNQIVAKISHLPHVLAAAQLLAISDSKATYELAASSFRDSTRVASSAPELTAGMVNNNREEVLRSIESLKGVLDEFADLLGTKDDAGVKALFERAKKLRDTNLQ